MRKAIAIDFDGCLCENAWPKIGVPNWDVIRAAQLEQHEGAALILWTCRNGDLLASAVEWCRERGLIFDAINENLPERVKHYGSESRKISADEYWDDSAVHMPQPPNAPLTLEELREMDGDKIYIRYIDGFYTDEDGAYFGKFEQLVRECNGKLTACELPLKYYGKTWLAYRRKPEEGTP